MQKECIECSKFISYKNWAIHLRTDKHVENVARCKIICDRQLQRIDKDREEKERMHAAAEKVVEKFKMMTCDQPVELEFNPVFKSKSKIKFNHHPSLPNNFRMLMLGASNCGKTNLLLKMILTPGCIDFNNLIIFSSTVEQKEY